jgi:uncharacterized membrane protein YoaK (UPF0700 family)
VRISEQTAVFALYVINSLVFITAVESVYSAVRTDSLYKADYDSSLTLNLLMSYICGASCTARKCMDLGSATLKAVSFNILHNVTQLNQRRKLSCGTVVCKNFASYQDYPNYRWDLIRYTKG